jgi:hypothetical protein
MSNPPEKPPFGRREGAPGEERDPAQPDSVNPGPTAGERPVEIGGRKGPDPTRYGDWEKNGRCIDF